MFSITSAPKNAHAKQIFAQYQHDYEAGLPIKNPEVLLDNLTKFQRLFVKDYLNHLDATKAVLNSGSKTKYPERIAWQLLRNPKIKLTIELLQLERAKNSSITKDYVLKQVVEIIESCKQDEAYNPNAALRGLELLARHLGMFIDRTEITGKDGEAIKYEKVAEDARDFQSAIDRLVDRNRTSDATLRVVGGNEG